VPEVKRGSIGLDVMSGLPCVIEDPEGKYVLYTDAVKMQRKAFVDGASWGQERANGIHAGGAEAEAERRYKEEE